MNTITDLHPHDTTARTQLLADLITARRTHRLSQTGLANRLGITQAAVLDLEHRTTWAIPTIQRWARAVGHRLTLTITGLPQPPTPFAAITSTDPARADEWARANLIDAYRAAREHLGITQAQAAHQLGFADTAVSQFEASLGVCQLATVQRNVRALGGELRVALHMVQPPPPLPVPVPSKVVAADHPDDGAARDRVRQQLIEARINAGLSQRDLAARMGRTHGSVGPMERRTAWGATHLIGWAQHLDLAVVFTPEGLPGGEAGVGERQLGCLAGRLIAARVALGWTQADLAARLGCRAGVVATWEQRQGAGSFVASVQRRTRALGGVLLLDLAPEPAVVGVAAA